MSSVSRARAIQSVRRWLCPGLLLSVAACDEAGTESWRNPSAAESGPPRVELLAEERHQRLEGFGASVAWYIDTLVNHPLKDEIYPKLFAELGLDILRFRNRHQRRSEPVDLAQESEIYERATQSLGHAPQLLISSWSPPGELKANGQENCTARVVCADGEGDCDGSAVCTLVRENGEFVYEKFADYWYSSLEEYATYGLVPDYISIQNEPDFAPSGWEGCRFAPSEWESEPGYDRALAAVHARLSSLETPPTLLGPEPQGVHYDKVPKYFASLDLNLLGGVAHHLYEKGGDGEDDPWDWIEPGPDSYTPAMMTVPPVSAGLPIFQTEFNTDEDEGTNGGFETAWLIHNSLVDEGVSAWLYWDLVWGGHGGMVTLLDDSYTLRDQYYSVRHYSRFTDPGDVRVGAETNRPTLRASAFMAPDGDRVTLVVLNIDAEDETLALELAGYELSEGYLTVYRPGASERWQPLALGAELLLPSRSVATLILHRPAGE